MSEQLPSAAPSAADRVRAAIADGRPPDKRDLERALRAIGLSKSQARKLLSRGYRAIAEDDTDEILEAIEQNVKKLRSCI